MSPTWTCTDCAVEVRYAAGHRSPALPPGWTRHRGGYRCLACRRDRAVEDALARADVEADDRRAAPAIRRRALAEFELRRDPDRADKALGNLTGQPANAIAEVRRELLAAGAIKPRGRSSATSCRRPRREPPPATPRRPADRFAELYSRVDGELRRDPSRSNAGIAEGLGCAASTVRERRRQLEGEGAIPKVERRGRFRGRSST